MPWAGRVAFERVLCIAVPRLKKVLTRARRTAFEKKRKAKELKRKRAGKKPLVYYRSTSAMERILGVAMRHRACSLSLSHAGNLQMV